MAFNGRLIYSDELPEPYESVDDHYVQIGKDSYMGPSGGLDDFVNHSCDPNSGLVITNTRVELVAIRDIKSGEEITWDYSTTMYGDDWKMNCQCNSVYCRHVVGNFIDLPDEIRKKYIQLGVVPSYNL